MKLLRFWSLSSTGWIQIASSGSMSLTFFSYKVWMNSRTPSYPNSYRMRLKKGVEARVARTNMSSTWGMNLEALRREIDSLEYIYSRENPLILDIWLLL